METRDGHRIEKTVQEVSSGKRLDAFLAAYTRTDGLSRYDTRVGIEAGKVSVNGKTESNPSKRLRHGDVVVSDVAPTEKAGLFPNAALSIPVLFEDEDLLIISKPAGIQMHPAGNDMTETVANWIAATRPEMAGVGDDPFRPGIVHRLDRNTSGVVILAKTEETFRILQESFRSHEVRKTYLALVMGHVPTESGSIDFPLAHRTGTLRRQAVMDPGNFSGETKTALTEYFLKARYAEYDLLEAFPKTGRTHQIRVHLSAIGCPVVGDRLYGGRRMGKDGMPKRQLLHAAEISFPFRGKERIFVSPLPDDFADFLSGIDGTRKEGYSGEASKGLSEA